MMRYLHPSVIILALTVFFSMSQKVHGNDIPSYHAPPVEDLHGKYDWLESHDAGSEPEHPPVVRSSDASMSAGFSLLPPVDGRVVKLVINEFMASNGRAVEDADGDFPPWIELYNAGHEPIDLTGWYLSDDTGNPLRWRFPDIDVIFPGDFQMVFASGKDKVYAGEYHTNFRISRDGEPLLLTASDGTTTIDFVPAVALNRNESYGRLLDGGDEWRRFGGILDAEYTGTTPGFTNIEGIQPIDAPLVDIPGGFYAEDFNLIITHPDPGVQILYSLDGSIPSLNNLNGAGEEYLINYFFFDSGDDSQNIARRNDSHVYLEPISVQYDPDKPNDLSEIITTYGGIINRSSYLWEPPAGNMFQGTVLRTRAIKIINDHIYKSEVRTHSYYIHPFGPMRYSLPVLSITTNAENIFGYENGIYVPGRRYFEQGGTASVFPGTYGNYHEDGPDWERGVHVEIFENSGEQSFSQNVGMRMHGGYGLLRTQKAFRLHARDRYDEKNDMLYAFFPGTTKSINDEPLEMFRRILFRQGGNWYNFLNDVLAHRIMERTHVGTQRCRRFLHFINGEYWGLINARDRLDEYHLARNYDIDPDNIIILHGPDSPTVSSWKLEAGYPEDVALYNEFHAYALDHDLNVDEHYETIQQMLCIDSYIDYHVMFLYFANRDWYGHRHFRFWRVRNPSNRPYQDGKWRIMVWDFDNAGQYHTYDLLSNALDPDGGGDEFNFRHGHRTALFRNMLENDAFRFRFINRFADHMNTTFTPHRVQPMVQHEYDILNVEMPEHIQRWHRNVANSYYLGKWLEFPELRPPYQRQHLIEHFNLSGEARITLNVDSPDHGFIRINTVNIASETPGIPKDVFPWSGIYFQGVPVELEALPHLGYRFAGWQGIDAHSATVTLDLTGDLTVTALFAEDTDNPVVDIPDRNLRHAIYLALGKEPDEPITQGELAELETLDVRNNQIRNLDGLQYAVNLQELNLRNNGITDVILAGMNLEILAELPRLWYLSLRENSLSNLNIDSSLRLLNQLTFLSIRDNHIEDISALQSLVNLNNLNARNNRITDITPLKQLASLQGAGSRLYLDGNPDLWDYTSLLPQYFNIETVDFNILHPRAHVLEKADYRFGALSSLAPAGQYPESMLFLQSDQDDPSLEAEMTGAYYVEPDEYHIEDQDRIGFPYLLTGRTRINGLNEYGIAFVNTGRGRDLGAAVLALDTRNVEHVDVSWIGGTLSPGSRVYHIRLQVREGRTGAFVDVMQHQVPVEYVRNQQAGHETTIGPVRLPAEYAGNPYIQLRWKYYYTGRRLTEEQGQRDQLRLDNILVTGTESDVTAIADETTPATAPVAFTLLGNYPNPFNSSTTIRYGLPKPAHVQLEVHNLLGQPVFRTSWEQQEAGFHQIQVDGRGWATGAYVYRLRAGVWSATGTMVLVR